MPQRILVCLWIALVLIVRPSLAGEAKTPAGADVLAAKLDPFLSCFSGKAAKFHLKLEIAAAVGRGTESAKVEIARTGEREFFLAVEHGEYPLRLLRGADRTVLVLPAHRTAFEGRGAVPGPDTLDPRGIGGRLVSQGTAAFPYLLVLASGTGPAAAGILANLAGLKSDDGSVWTAPSLRNARLTFSESPPALEATDGRSRVRVERLDGDGAAPEAPAVPADFKTVSVDRSELERVLSRGARRALEVLAPSALLVQPPREERKVPGGELRWVEDQRLAILRGTPREIGQAHGKLLTEEARRCADSVLYLVGVAQTVRKGKWFLDEIREAYRRLEPHIPARWKEEVEGLAEGAGFDLEEARLANVFPELFHCSGFAVFGKATVGGKLYHGRVLDYMTAIGIQDSAVLLVVHPEGRIPFANVGYAGFVGSVSGMNAQGISLGEMGGRGEGQWDGVPMATLMRRALEECSSLDEVKKLWTESPRTCEYYYVFADGKIPDAVGVGATPQRIEFVKPGEAHPLLGEGIPDAVLLSADERLRTLRERVKENHGRIDAEKALWLMSRPVAMRSNLHNALFVPQDLAVYVAHASRADIAANRHYVKYDLAPLFAAPAAK